MSFLRLMKDIDKGNFEYKHGRIRFADSCYLEQGKYPKIEEADLERFSGTIPTWSVKDQNGVTYQMISKRGVFCPFPDEHERAYITDKGAAMVAASACQKCQHRIKADKRGPKRWPRCARAIKERAEEKMESSLDLLAKATREVDGWMK